MYARRSRVYMCLGIQRSSCTAPPSMSTTMHYLVMERMILTYCNPGRGNQLTRTIKCKVSPFMYLTYLQLKESHRFSGSVRHLRLLYECQNSPAGGVDSLDMNKDIWILLTRHFSDTRRGAEYVSLTVNHDEDDWGDLWLKSRDMEVKVN